MHIKKARLQAHRINTTGPIVALSTSSFVRSFVRSSRVSLGGAEVEDGG